MANNPLNPQAQTLLQKLVSNGTFSAAVCNGLTADAAISPYFAALLNTFAAIQGASIVLGNATSTNGTTITVDSTFIPAPTNGITPAGFALILAHELGHSVLDDGMPGFASNPDQAVANGETAEGVAITAAYIVATQLGTQMHSDPDDKLTPELNRMKFTDSGRARLVPLIYTENMKISSTCCTIIRFLAGLAVMAAISVFPLQKQTSGASTQKEHIEMAETSEANDLNVRGKELRKAIDETYKSLAKAKALKTMGHGRNFISDVVLRYIPIGTSFDDAEAVLRAAGFEIGPRGRHPVLVPERYGVWATIDHYASTGFGDTSVGVYLLSSGRNNWSAVTGIEAEITKQFI